jgi:hypothetical protein
VALGDRFGTEVKKAKKINAVQQIRHLLIGENKSLMKGVEYEKTKKACRRGKVSCHRKGK